MNCSECSYWERYRPIYKTEIKNKNNGVVFTVHLPSNEDVERERGASWCEYATVTAIIKPHFGRCYSPRHRFLIGISPGTVLEPMGMEDIAHGSYDDGDCDLFTGQNFGCKQFKRK